MTKKEDMKNKTDQELAAFVADTAKALRGERFASAGARPKDPSAAGKFRKSIARAKTELRARTLRAVA